MKRRLVAQKLIDRLSQKMRHRLNFRKTLLLGIVLKGLPVAYGLAKANDVVENFVPLVAQRGIYMQHEIESYFPSSEWEAYLVEQSYRCDLLLVVDDVVNTGFTRQKVESIVGSLSRKHSNVLPKRFAALILNRTSLASSSFISRNDFYALEVSATEVECDWGLMTVPLWDLSVETARKRCEEYYQRFWANELRWITITY